MQIRRHLLDVNAEDVTELLFERGDLQVHCVRKEDLWLLQYPIESRADGGRVEAILSHIESLPSMEVVTPEEREARRLTIADYGLSRPRARLVIKTSVRRYEILIGRKAPVGDNIYVKLGTEDNVVGTTSSLLDSIPQSLDELRDRTLLPGQAGRTVRIELRRADGGFIQLGRVGNTWHMQQPLEVPAEGGRVESMLDRLFEAEVVKFVWDPSPVSQSESVPASVDLQPDTPVQTFGLADDEAAVRVHVWLSGDRVGRELILGKAVEDDENLVYAKLRDSDSVFAVPASLVRTFAVRVNEIRSRNVFTMSASEVGYACFQEGDIKLVLARRGGSWLVTQPVQWQADDELVKDLISKLCRLRVVEFVGGSGTNGVDDLNPTLQIQLLPEEPPQPASGEVIATEPAVTRQPAPANQGRLQVGVMDPSSETALAKYENESEYMRIRTAEMLALGIRPSEPLLYRDRSILSLSPGSIRRLHIWNSGFEEAVVRDAEGNWVAEMPPDGKINQRVVTDILLAAAGIRATWIESHNPDELTVYGLASPSGTVTFGLTGDAGIQKSVFLGKAAGQVGVYAMVKGQDVVFVLPAKVTSLFSRQLMIPAVQDESPGPEESNEAAE